jgi:hypothetical protein
MKHPNRAYGVTEVPDLKTLANNLFHYSWSRCTGYQLGNYLFLNDSLSNDGVQEVAVFKQIELDCIQIETITISNWQFNEYHLELVLIAAMESENNMGVYNHLKLSDISEQLCDLCERKQENFVIDDPLCYQDDIYNHL